MGFYQTSFTSGLAKRYFLICDQCATSTDFYALPKNDISTDYGEKREFGHDMMQILGGRLHGVGKSGIDALNSIIGLSTTLATHSFSNAQNHLAKVSKEIAERSCDRAAKQLRDKFCTCDDEFLEAIVSYDGAYQRRGGKHSGGFSRYCFSSVISLETGKVLSYEVACNSCKYCVEKQQVLKFKNITVEEYSEWLSEHGKTCQASEYGSYASTAIESQLAPVVFRKSI